MADAEQGQEPVKIKMKLHAARPSVQGAAPTRPAAQAAIEAVEARWRTEDKKVKADRRKKRFTGCLSWIFILLAAAGAAWYFLGPKYLPAEYTFPQVWPKVLELWQGKAQAEPATDPADSAMAGQRTRLGGFVSLLEKSCKMKPPVQGSAGMVEQMRQSAGHKIFESVISADSAYAKAQKRFEDMNAKNAKLAEKPKNNDAPHRYIDEYSAEDLIRQQGRVEELEAACAKARVQAVKRAIESVKVATAKWTGPESKRDAAQFNARLIALAKTVKGK